MISNQDRQALIDYRLQQAKKTTELAKFLIDSDQFVVAVNRIYYGMYYVVTALAIKHKFETSKHGQLIGWFNKEFVSTGILKPDYGKMLRNAFQNRTKGDYDAFVTFEKEEVIEMHEEMIDFIVTLEKLVKKDNM